MTIRSALVQVSLAAITVAITFAMPIELDRQAVRLAFSRSAPSAPVLNSHS